jgi:hypothetical protein
MKIGLIQNYIKLYRLKVTCRRKEKLISNKMHGKKECRGIWNREKEADEERIWGNDRRKEAQQQGTGRVNLSPPATPASSAKHAVRVVPRK